jgi:WD40 repeat protein
MSAMMPAQKRIQLMFILLIAIAAFLATAQAQESSDLTPLFEYEADWGILDLDWSFDSKLLAFVVGDDGVLVINAETGEIEQRLVSEVAEIYAIVDIAWSPEEYYLFIANNLTKIWDYLNQEWLESFEFPRSIDFQNYYVWGNVDWRPNGKQIAVVLSECEESSGFRTGARVELWDIISSTPVEVGNCLAGGIANVRWNPNGTRISFVELDRVTIWNIENNEATLIVNDIGDVYDLAWSPDGLRFAIGISKGVRLDGISEDGFNYSRVVQIRDGRTGKVLAEMDGHTSTVSSLDWHPAGRFVATGSHDNTVRLWDVENNTQQLVINAHTDTVYEVAWSPDGSMLASAGRDGKLFIWHTSTLLESGT